MLNVDLFEVLQALAVRPIDKVELVNLDELAL
jgi:hypothetical protein